MDGERESSVTYNMAEKFTYARTIRNPHLLCLIICWCFCWLVVWKATCSTNCPAWFMPFRTRKLYASLFFVVGFCSTPHSEIAIAFHWAKIRNVCVSSREIIMRRCSFGVWVCSPFVLLLLRASHFSMGNSDYLGKEMRNFTIGRFVIARMGEERYFTWIS